MAKRTTANKPASLRLHKGDQIYGELHSDYTVLHIADHEQMGPPPPKKDGRTVVLSFVKNHVDFFQLVEFVAKTHGLTTSGSMISRMLCRVSLVEKRKG